MPASDASGVMLQVRQYSSARRPNDLRDVFVELVVELKLNKVKAAILAHECAHASRATAWPATFNTLIRDHNMRAATSDIRLPALGLKAQACRELLLDRM